MRIIATLIFVMVTLAVAKDDCSGIKSETDAFVSRIEKLKDEEPDKDFYRTQREQYQRLTMKLLNAECTGYADSLRMRLIMYYAEFIVKPQGDLENYQTQIIQCKNMMERYRDELKKNLISQNLSLDVIRDDWQPTIDFLSSSLEDLDGNYKPMTIFINRQNGKPFTEMTTVLSQAGKQTKPVEVHFRPPKDVMENDVKRRRLMFLSSQYELVLKSYDEKKGFYFDIPLVPLSSRIRVKPEETYAITFDQKVRYRVLNFNSAKQDSLTIMGMANWVYQSIVPTTYSKIQIPANMSFYIYDIQQQVKIDNDIFTIVRSPETTNIYLPNNPELQYELRLQASKQRNLLFFLTMLSITLTLGGAYYVSL